MFHCYKTNTALLLFIVSLTFVNQALSQSLQEWENRKTELRECVSARLHLDTVYKNYKPNITLTPARTHKEYSVNNIAIETVPGLFVCGSVYKPVHSTKKLPVVLVPNGHFPGGRYREDIQQICASLARMGAMAISYDMFGWGESRLQVREEDHYTSLAMKVQKMNTTALLDYVSALPETDNSRIAITGASGGGSQAMINTALDDRIKVSVPVVMLSADYPGGCQCETGIPVHQCGKGTNNAEIAAMAAPRPQLVISCGKDWTANVPQKEFPYLQKIYNLYGKADAVKNVHLQNEDHDYGYNKRKAMYYFMAEHLQLNINAILNDHELDESAIVIEEEKKLLVFGEHGEKLPAQALKGIDAIKTALNFSQLEVQIGNKSISLLKDAKELLKIDSISINFIAQHSQKITRITDDSVLIQLFYPLMPDFNRLETGFDHTLDIGVSFRNNVFHFSAKGDWVTNFTIHMTDRNDHFFGLQETLYPDNKKSPNLRGSVIDVEINGQQYRYQENFASAWSSFYFNPKGYASFINSFAKGKYHLAINGVTSLYHETNTLDWYIFTGDHQEIYSQYYKVIGAPKKVPLWSCGPIVWRDENKNGSKEILDDARGFSKLNIPITAMMVDRPYSNGSQLWSKMDFNDNFRNPQQWIKTLKDSFNLNFVTWIAPATFSDTAFPGLLSGSFSYIDLTHPSALTEFSKRLKNNQYAYGVRGHKMDRADEQFPENESWYERTPVAERKNKYVYLYARVTDSILKSYWGNDQLNYARAAIHGSQPYLSGIWGGDPKSTWDGMAGNLANSIRASFMGFPNWGTDVGGYLGQSGRIDEQLYIRWLQWGVFNGIYEIKLDGPSGVGEDRVPWNCSEKVQRAFREACEMRMEWLPHIYSQLNTSSTYGVLMKPLAMVYPNDTLTYSIWDEYIFGNSLLIAPVLSDGSSRTVYLPEGKWIDPSGNVIDGKKYITVKLDDFSIPVFIKSNSIHAKGNIYDGKQYVDFYCYPGSGAAMDFVNPVNQEITRITLRQTDNRSMISVPAIGYNGTVKIFFKQKPATVKINGKRTSVTYKDNYIIVPRKADRDLIVECVE